MAELPCAARVGRPDPRALLSAFADLRGREVSALHAALRAIAAPPAYLVTLLGVASAAMTISPRRAPRLPLPLWLGAGAASALLAAAWRTLHGRSAARPGAKR